MIKNKTKVATPTKLTPNNNKYQIWVILAVIALDQALKWFVKSQHLFWVLNHGAAFSFGSQWPWFEWVVWGSFALLLVLSIKYQVFREKNYKLQNTKYKQILNTVSWAILIGGAISNLIDRLLWGGVVDYIKLWRFPVFNLADAGITIAVGLILLGYII